MKTPREVAEDVLAQEPWAAALWDREAAIALVVEAVEQSRREYAALTGEGDDEFNVGDRVRLTGRDWGVVSSLQGEVVTVSDIKDGEPEFKWRGAHWAIYRDYDSDVDFSATKVED